MGGGGEAVCLALPVVSIDLDTNKSKRSNQWVAALDETKPNKKPAKESSIGESNSEVLNPHPQTVKSSGTSTTAIKSIKFTFSKSKESYNDNGVVVPPCELDKDSCLSPYVTSVKKLLATGILEGFNVKYMKQGIELLYGSIMDWGYLCGCRRCRFNNIVSAFEFEQHAGCKTNHPNSNIFLQNGMTLFSIVEKLRNKPIELLDHDKVRELAGFSVFKGQFQGKRCRDFHTPGDHQELPQSVAGYPSEAVEEGDRVWEEDDCSQFDQMNSYHDETMEDSFCPASTSMVSRCTSKEQNRVTKRPTGQCRANSIASKSVVQRKSTGNGQRKRRDNDLHRLPFMPNGLPDGAELGYYAKGKRVLEGYKQGNGIVCACCNSEISPSTFEAHAGWASRRKPYHQIYTADGISLHDLSLSLANRQNSVTADADDMSTVRGDGADLIHCEVQAPAIQFGGCVLCRTHDYCVEKFDERTVLLCDQCEREYHVGCLRSRGLCDLKELPKGKWFCCDDCSKIHTALRNFIFTGAKKIPSSLSNSMNRKLIEKGLTNEVGDDVRWQLLSGKVESSEHNSLLSRVAKIFQKSFHPIPERTSRRNMIPAMVYGRNIAGIEFGGMYCAVLSVRSVVVSAATIRIFGKEAAEIPLVATVKGSQGRGYCQALFSCIESFLGGLNVENLVLPAAEKAVSMWTNKFGFKRMTDDRFLEFRKDMQLMTFTESTMLEKRVPQKTEKHPSLVTS